MTFAYFKASFADSAAYEVILGWDGQAFSPRVDLMRQPAPTQAALQKITDDIHANWGVMPPDVIAWPAGFAEGRFTQPLLDLIYTGHEDLASRWFDAAWPDRIPGKAEYKADFLATLTHSRIHPVRDELRGEP